MEEPGAEVEWNHPAYRLCCVKEQHLRTEAGVPKAVRAEPAVPDLPRSPEGTGKAA